MMISTRLILRRAILAALLLYATFAMPLEIGRPSGVRRRQHHIRHGPARSRCKRVSGAAGAMAWSGLRRPQFRRQRHHIAQTGRQTLHQGKSLFRCDKFQARHPGHQSCANDSKHPGDGSLDADNAVDNWRHKDNYISDYKEIISAFRKANASVKVFVCLPTPDYPGRWGINDKTIRNEMIPMIRRIAKDTDATVIDLYTALSGKSELFPDSVHPNDEGARLIASEVFLRDYRKEAAECQSYHTFAIGPNDFLLDGKPLVIRCGEMHFARVPREYWRHRLQLLKAMGMNSVCAYLFWNYHECEPGKYNWSDQADVAEFCRMAQQEGLWVVLRPGPYVWPSGTAAACPGGS